MTSWFLARSQTLYVEIAPSMTIGSYIFQLLAHLQKQVSEHYML